MKLSNEYYEKSKTKKVNPHLKKSLEIFFKNNATRLFITSNTWCALDIGCAAGSDSLFLAKKGFLVDSLDIDPRAIKIVREHKNRDINPILEDVSKFKFKESNYDLVIAYWVLFFLGDAKLGYVLDNIHRSLRPNGIFSGILLGERDEWKQIFPSYSYLNENDIKKYLAKFKILELKEMKRSGTTLTGQKKYWHYFQFIVQKI